MGSSRFEVKYLITSEVRNAFLAQMSARMRPDPHCTRGDAYPVYTYYLDSPDLTMYHEKMAGLLSRTKVRVRYYEGPHAPVKLEIKERLDNQVIKSDFPLNPATLNLVLQAQPIPSRTPDDYALHEYHRFLHFHHIRPNLHMEYLRTAYMCAGPGAVRITFDTEIRVRRFERPGELWRPLYTCMHPQWMILEIKFTSVMPLWINELCRRFSLQNETICKYVWGVNRLLKLGELATSTPTYEGFPETEARAAPRAEQPVSV